MNNLQERLETVNNQIQSEKGERDLLQKKLSGYKKRRKKLKKELDDIQKAAEIIRKVAQETQEEIEYYISEIPSLALGAVFKDPYTFDVSFTERNKKTEADITFIRDNMQIRPYDGSGFGSIDVASYGARLAMFNIRLPKLRPVLILDEPFKHLKGERENKNVIQMIKKMSEELKIQVIMVHDERVSLDDIRKGADRIFKVTMKKKVREVEEI